MLFFSTPGKQIFGLNFCVEYSGQITSSQPKQIGVGTNPRTVAILSENEFYMTLLHQDSFCGNSHQHNTQATVRMCDQKPTSTQGVLTYSYAKWADWVNYLNSKEVFFFFFSFFF